MAFVVADRVQETTTTTGTGTVTLAGAVTGFQSFSAIGNGNSTFYTIADQSGSNWEVGIGTYTSSGTTLSRTTVLSSSNSGSLVNFGAGTKNVFVTYPAGRSAYAATVPSNGQLLIGNGTDFTLGTLTQGTGISITNASGSVTISSTTSGGSGYSTSTFTGNGSTTSFDTTVSGLTVNNVLVLENGVAQVPTTDYTISGTSVVFTTAPASGVAIQVRVLGGGGASGVIAENQQTISSNYSVTSAYNGSSVGPVTINTGVAVTVGTAQRWLIFG
jgi:hypothetical protein